MGAANASYHEPSTTVPYDESLPVALREKISGLDYRVRKTLGRYADDIADRDSDNSDSECNGNQNFVVYHESGVPESLYRMRLPSVGFTINMDAVRRELSDNECCVGGESESETESSSSSGGGCRSTTHSVILEPPAVQLPPGAGKIPRVKVTFWFSVEKALLTHRLLGKSAIGAKGRRKLGVGLRMRVESEVDSNWHAPGCVGFALSHAFQDGVDAEAEGEDDFIEPKRWWNAREHLRQQAQQPLNEKVLRPMGPYAESIDNGHAILDLNRCNRLPICINKLQPWRAAGASRRSAETVWALLCDGPKRQFATAFGKVRACHDVAHNIALFVLEAVQYEFETEIVFGVGLANF